MFIRKFKSVLEGKSFSYCSSVEISNSKISFKPGYLFLLNDKLIFISQIENTDQFSIISELPLFDADKKPTFKINHLSSNDPTSRFQHKNSNESNKFSFQISTNQSIDEIFDNSSIFCDNDIERKSWIKLINFFLNEKTLKVNQLEFKLYKTDQDFVNLTSYRPLNVSFKNFQDFSKQDEIFKNSHQEIDVEVANLKNDLFQNFSDKSNICQINEIKSLDEGTRDRNKSINGIPKIYSTKPIQDITQSKLDKWKLWTTKSPSGSIGEFQPVLNISRMKEKMQIGKVFTILDNTENNSEDQTIESDEDSESYQIKDEEVSENTIRNSQISEINFSGDDYNDINYTIVPIIEDYYTIDPYKIAAENLRNNKERNSHVADKKIRSKIYNNQSRNISLNESELGLDATIQNDETIQRKCFPGNVSRILCYFIEIFLIILFVCLVVKYFWNLSL